MYCGVVQPQEEQATTPLQLLPQDGDLSGLLRRRAPSGDWRVRTSPLGQSMGHPREDPSRGVPGAQVRNQLRGQ